jgi:Skp family chaperone for outer membrane proteins
MNINQVFSSEFARPRSSTLSLGCIPVRTGGFYCKVVWRSALWLVFANALAVPANSDSAAAGVAAVNARQLLEQAPQTEYALNALKVELGPRRDKLISMQRDLKAHLEQFKHTSQSLTAADRDAAHEALDAETQTFHRTAQEFQADAVSKRDQELGKVRKFITHEIELYAANNGFKTIAQYEGEVPHGELDLTKKIHVILLEKPRQLPAGEASEPN